MMTLTNAMNRSSPAIRTDYTGHKAKGVTPTPPHPTHLHNDCLSVSPPPPPPPLPPPCCYFSFVCGDVTRRPSRLIRCAVCLRLLLRGHLGDVQGAQGTRRGRQGDVEHTAQIGEHDDPSWPCALSTFTIYHCVFVYPLPLLHPLLIAFLMRSHLSL